MASTSRATCSHTTLDTRTTSALPVILVNSVVFADTSTDTINKRKTASKECHISQKRYTITDSLSVISDPDSGKKRKRKAKKVTQQKKAKVRNEPVTVDFYLSEDNNISVEFESGFRIKSPARDNLPKRKKAGMSKKKGGTNKASKPRSKACKPRSKANKLRSKASKPRSKESKPCSKPSNSLIKPSDSNLKSKKHLKFLDRFSFKKKDTSSLSSISSAPSVKNVGTNESRGSAHFLEELNSYPIFQECLNGPNMPPYHLERFDYPSSVNSKNEIYEETSDMSESDTSNTTIAECSELTVSEHLHVLTDEYSSRSSEYTESLSSIVSTDEYRELRRSYHSIGPSSMSSEMRAPFSSSGMTDEGPERKRPYHSIIPSNRSSEVRASFNSIGLTDKGPERRQSYHSTIPSSRTSEVRVSFNSIGLTDKGPEVERPYHSIISPRKSSEVRVLFSSTVPTDKGPELEKSYNSIVPSRRSSKSRVSFSSDVPTDKDPEVERSYHSTVPPRRSSNARATLSSNVPTNKVHSIFPSRKSSEVRVSFSSSVPTDKGLEVERSYHSIVPSGKSSEVRVSFSSSVPTDKGPEVERSHHSIIPSRKSSDVRVSFSSTVPTDKGPELEQSYHSIVPSRRSSKVRATLSHMTVTDKGSELRRSYHSIVPSRRSSKVSLSHMAMTDKGPELRRSAHSIAASLRSSEVRASFSSIVPTEEDSELTFSYDSYQLTEESSRMTMSDISILPRRSQQEVRSLFDLDTYTYPVVDARLNKKSRPYVLKKFECPTFPVYYANLLCEKDSETSASETSIAGSYQKPCSVFDFYSYPIIDASLKEDNRPYALEKIDLRSSRSVCFLDDRGEESDGTDSGCYASRQASFAELPPWGFVKGRTDGSITPSSEKIKFMAFEYSTDHQNSTDSRDVSTDDEDYRPSVTSLGSWSSFTPGVSRSSVNRDDISDICTSLSSMWSNLFLR